MHGHTSMKYQVYLYDIIAKMAESKYINWVQYAVGMENIDSITTDGKS